MKSTSVGFSNLLFDIKRSVSAFNIEFSNLRIATAGNFKSASVEFSGGDNFSVITVDRSGLAVSGADVSVIEQGLVFRGDLDVSAGVPVDAVVGDCYRQSANVDVAGELWEVDDLAVVVTGMVFSRMVHRFSKSSVAGIASISCPYNADFDIIVTHPNYQLERHWMHVVSGVGSHAATLFPLVSSYVSPHGTMLSSNPADRGNIGVF